MVYAKLDWYTVMLHNMSFKEVLEKLNCFSDICDEILNSGYQRSYGYSTDIVYSVNGVSVQVNFDDILSVNEENIFFTKWSTLRLDLSGSGLDYLRTLNDNLEAMLMDKSFWGEEGFYTITRCDFAFDFVNHFGSFLDLFINRLHELERSFKIERGRDGNTYLGTSMGVDQRGRNTTYSMRVGSKEKCLYLGSNKSKKLVRIYDKKMQQTQNGVFVKGVPQYFQGDDKNVDSWFRIELQTRREYAHKYLFGCNGTLKTVLRELFDTYQCKDPETKQTFDFIMKLYDWDTLPKIIENLHFTELSKKVLVRAKEQLQTQAVKNLILFYGKYGLNGILSIIEGYLNMINRANKAPPYSSVKDPRDRIPLREINSNIAFRCRYSQLLEEEGLKELPFLHYLNDEFFIGDWRTVVDTDEINVKLTRTLDDYVLKSKKFKKRKDA